MIKTVPGEPTTLEQLFTRQELDETVGELQTLAEQMLERTCTESDVPPPAVLLSDWIDGKKSGELVMTGNATEYLGPYCPISYEAVRELPEEMESDGVLELVEDAVTPPNCQLWRVV